jgi:DNA topoisomerase-1
LKDVDIDHQFRVTYHPIESKRAQIAKLRETVAQYSKDHVILATDNDREGEAIAYHLCIVLDLPLATTHRIVFNEITASALQHAICHPQKLNMSLVYSAMARQVLDVLIGFKISPVLWKYIYSSKTRPLSAGRCQTPALRLIYDHSLQTQVSRVSYRTTAHMWDPCGGGASQMHWVLSHEFECADMVRSFLNASAKHTFLGMGPCKVSKSAPPIPLNTSRLLQRAASALHWSPKQVMSVAQQLYQHGHITYMRTESTQYSREFLTTAAAFIHAQWPDHSYVHPQLDRLANIDDNMPHEAVRVTHLDVTEIPVISDSTAASASASMEASASAPASASASANGAMANALYCFIWTHTVESCMSESLADTHLLQISTDTTDTPEYVFEHTLTVPTHMGWKAVRGRVGSDVATTLAVAQRMYFQCLATGSTVHFHQIEARIIERGRSGHYTEAGLIQALEDRGIGRPSTFATFVETIQERGYVTKRDLPGTPQSFTEFVLQCDDLHFVPASLPKSTGLRPSDFASSKAEPASEITVTKNLGAETAKLVLEPLGYVCIEFLLTHFGELFDYSYTETMERALDAELNADTWYILCQRTLEDVTRMLPRIPPKKKECGTAPRIHPVYHVADDKECRIWLQEHGLVISRSDAEYLPLKPGLRIDMNRLREGSYLLHELVAYTTPYLGEHQGRPVTLCSGPYGIYVRWGDKDGTDCVRKTLNEEQIQSLAGFSLADAIAILDPITDDEKEEDASAAADTSKIMRALTPTMSIRRGKFGCYVHCHSPDMPQPKFISLKKFPGKFLDVEVDQVILWTQEQMANPPPPFRRKFRKK